MKNTKEKVWSVLNAPIGLVKHSNYGDLLTLADFLDMCRGSG